MKTRPIIFILTLILQLNLPANGQPLPVWSSPTQKSNPADWLINNKGFKAQVFTANDGKELVLYNGLLKRTFRITPNVACVDYENMSNGGQLLRAVKAEARLNINGRDYNIGGLYGQKENAYILPGELDKLKAGANDFQFVDYTINPISPYLNWETRFWMPIVPPASGKEISFRYKASAPELNGLEVKVNYELYDGIPLIEKSLSIENKGDRVFKINRVVNEIMGMVEEESAVVGKPEDMKKNQGIYFETNYAFNNAMRYSLSDQVTHWKIDTAYTSQVNYDFQTPCLLEIYPEQGPGIDLKPGGVFNSVRTNELLMDSYDRERRGLEVRKMYNVIAPWTAANPIFMHLVSHNDDDVRRAVDQCAVTGYEAVILSFGSHLNMEDTSAANLKRWKELADYAHSKHIRIGGYDLFSSRQISDADDVIDPKTGKPGGALFGHAPCFGSKWGLAFRDKIENFFTQTGFDIWENDGPYPGDLCASTTHPGHEGLDDSQWRQMEIQKGLYHWLNARGIYVNAPDWYFLDGSNKIAIGYREVNFSLPREDQKILNRQNIFDGTWEKTPAMGWGFVPLTRYQGGGPEAVLEPLSEHLNDYKALMMEYYGSGVQACYRGPRLYDTDKTREMVKEVIAWYKKYREILNSDIIHLRRPDGRDWDGILHVNPRLKIKGLAMLYNPTATAITRHIKLPLYYTGLTKVASIREKGDITKIYKLNRDYSADISVSIPANSYTWLTIE
ncbi:MAG: alpha-galactosidase [Sphingobacteriales bacterium]